MSDGLGACSTGGDSAWPNGPPTASSGAPCGRVLLEIGAVGPAYPRRCSSVSVTSRPYVGEGRRDPATPQRGSRPCCGRRSRCAEIEDPVDWTGFPVTLCVAIAARRRGPIEILGPARRDPGSTRTRRRAARGRQADAVLRLLQPVGDADDLSYLKGSTRMKVARFHPPATSGSRRPTSRRPVRRSEDQVRACSTCGTDLKNLPPRPLPHRPAARDGTRDSRRGRRGSAPGSRAPRSETGCRSSPRSRTAPAPTAGRAG